MGQEDTCGICGKHYQECRHYCKEHIPSKNSKAICGRNDVLLLNDDWADCDINMDDVCKDCLRYWGIKE